MEILGQIYCKHFDFTISCCGMDRRNQYKKVTSLKQPKIIYFYKFVDSTGFIGFYTIEIWCKNLQKPQITCLEHLP